MMQGDQSENTEPEPPIQKEEAEMKQNLNADTDSGHEHESPVEQKKKRKKRKKKKTKGQNQNELITTEAVVQILQEADMAGNLSEEEQAKEDKLVDEFRKRLETICDDDIVGPLESSRSSTLPDSTSSRGRKLKPNFNRKWLSNLAGRLSEKMSN